MLKDQQEQLHMVEGVVSNALIINSYMLLETESQLRGDELRKEKEKPKDTGLQTA